MNTEEFEDNIQALYDRLDACRREISEVGQIYARLDKLNLDDIAGGSGAVKKSADAVIKAQKYFQDVLSRINFESPKEG